MKLFAFCKSSTFWLILLLWSASAAAQVSSGRLEAALVKHREDVSAFQEEIENLMRNREEAETKLLEYQENLSQKERKLAETKQLAIQNQTAEHEDAVQKELKQVELMQLMIKSRVATIVRLESKEQELRGQMEKTVRLIAQKERALQRARSAPRQAKSQVKRVSKPTQSASVAKERREKEEMRSKLEALERENARLRRLASQVIENESAPVTKSENMPAARQLNSNRRPATRKQQPQVTKDALNTANLTLDTTGPDTKQTVADSSQETNPEQIKKLSRQQAYAYDVMRDAIRRANSYNGVPIEPRALTISGNGVSLSSHFEHLGGHQYRAEAVVRGGEGSIFNVGKRRFKVTIPEKDLGEIYVFIYDRSKRNSPKLYLFKRALLEQAEALAGDVTDAF